MDIKMIRKDKKMKISRQEYQPLKFLDETSAHKHFVLIYDEPEYGKMIECKFVENGLKKGINCIYLTHGNAQSAENQMKQYGIDVKHYKEKNLLHFVDIDIIKESPEGISSAFDNFMQKIMNNFESPYYILGRTIQDISTKTGMEAELEAEHTMHNNFKKYQCSCLCTYHIDEIEKNMRKKWVNHLLDHHHSVIYATEPNKAIGFDLTLLD